MHKIILLISLLLPFSIATAAELAQKEITHEKAIQIAISTAEKSGFSTKETDIEILKVKKGLERGPIRMVSLVRQFPKSMSETITKNEYWIIFFYPEGQMEKVTILGGDFTVFVELYSGNVLETFAGK